MTRYNPPSLPVRLVMAVLAMAATVGSGVLLYESLASGAALPGCGPESGCVAVLSSGWSKWLGIPVAAPALVLYAATLGGLWHTRPSLPLSQQRRAWMLLFALSFAFAGAAAWFMAVQWLFVGAFCKYCLTVHGMGLTLAAMIWFTAPVGQVRITPDEPADAMMVSPAKASGLALAGLLPVLLLIAGQHFFPAPTTRTERLGGTQDIDTGPGQDRQISILGGRVRLSPHDYPTLGSADSPVLLVSLFDYTCPHCQKLHEQLGEAREVFGEQLGVITLPVPLSAECNPEVDHTEPRHQASCDLARLALAVFRADADQFEAFDAWLFEPDEPRTVAEARGKAMELLGPVAFEAAMADPWVNEQLARDVVLYKLAGGGTLPQLIYRNSIIRGRPETAEQLIEGLRHDTPLQSVTIQP